MNTVWLRRLWAAPASALGLLLALPALATGARARHVQGALEVQGGGLRWAARLGLPFSAITLGHVILATHEAELRRHHVHERAHVAQFERYGAFFLLLYPAGSLWAWARGRRAYWDNPFEREARVITARTERRTRSRRPTAARPRRPR